MTAQPAELTFVNAHTRSVVKALKPRLAVLKQSVLVASPINTVAPALTGTGTVGQVLTCAPGTWLNSPTFTYQWRRGGFAISAATAATYTLVAGDSGKTIDCVVTGTNVNGVHVQPSGNSIVVT